MISNKIINIKYFFLYKKNLMLFIIVLFQKKFIKWKKIMLDINKILLAKLKSKAIPVPSKPGVFPDVKKKIFKINK